MSKTLCPCGSGQSFESCCDLYIRGTRPAPTPEALMRSRYSAYVTQNEPYLRATLAPEQLHDYDAEAVKKWARDSEWLGLEILRAEGDTVEFIARYRMAAPEGKGDGPQDHAHHEISKFRQHQGKWLFVEGRLVDEGRIEPIVRGAPKTGRNDPCTCGSGKKFKKCCG